MITRGMARTTFLLEQAPNARVLPFLAQYAAVQKRIEPMAAAVTNAGTNATALAVNTMNKYEITPTPKKKKAI